MPGMDHGGCSRMVEGHSWTTTSFCQPPGPSTTVEDSNASTKEVGPRVRDPNQVVSEAQSRVVKLEAANTALGENDPAVPRLREELIW